MGKKESLLIVGIIGAVLAGLFLALPATADLYNFTKANESDLIEFDKSDALENFSTNTSWDSFSDMVQSAYTDVWGKAFYLFIFGVPLLMLWIRQENVIIPTVLGMIIGVAGFSFLPPEYRYTSVMFLALSFAGIIFLIYKSRR